MFFLHEDLIIEALQKSVEDKLLGCNSSRTYYTQVCSEDCKLFKVEKFHSFRGLIGNCETFPVQ